jgi:hypothetical protein
LLSFKGSGMNSSTFFLLPFAASSIGISFTFLFWYCCCCYWSFYLVFVCYNLIELDKICISDCFVDWYCWIGEWF